MSLGATPLNCATIADGTANDEDEMNEEDEAMELDDAFDERGVSTEGAATAAVGPCVPLQRTLSRWGNAMVYFAKVSGANQRASPHLIVVL